MPQESQVIENTTPTSTYTHSRTYHTHVKKQCVYTGAWECSRGLGTKKRGPHRPCTPLPRGNPPVKIAKTSRNSASEVRCLPSVPSHPKRWTQSGAGENRISSPGCCNHPSPTTHTPTKTQSMHQEMVRGLHAHRCAHQVATDRGSEEGDAYAAHARTHTHVHVHADITTHTTSHTLQNAHTYHHSHAYIHSSQFV